MAGLQVKKGKRGSSLNRGQRFTAENSVGKKELSLEGGERVGRGRTTGGKGSSYRRGGRENVNPEVCKKKNTQKYFPMNTCGHGEAIKGFL